MRKKSIALTLLLGIGLGLTTVANMVGRPYATASTLYAPSQATPTLSINDVSITEGNTGTSNMVFTVTLTASGARPTIGVAYDTADGPPPSGATAPSDYASISNHLIFPSGTGTTTMTISVPINGDTSVEPDETFFVNLRNADGATITDGQGVGTIINDDSPPPLPALSINDISVIEGNTGTVNAVFTVSLSAASSSGVTVNYTSADGTATLSDNDYTSTSGTVTFLAGDATPKTISVPVIGDTRSEPNETFLVNLSGAQGATIADGQGICTIINDDTATLPALSINNSSVSEGDAGTVDAVFTVSLSGTSSSAVTVNYATADGTATVADHDYMSRSGTLTFPAGDVSPMTISVPVIGDTIVEGTESFFVNLSNPAGATIADGQGSCLIFTEEECSYSLSPTSLVFPPSGGTGSFNVITTAACHWSSFTNSPWITISSGTGLGSGTVSFSVAPNSIGDRTGHITINGAVSFFVFQNDNDSCFISLDPDRASCYEDGCVGNVAVTAPVGCTWTATSNTPWITITSGATGSGSGTVTFSVAPNSFVGSNPGTARTGSITIAGQVFTVSQRACSLALETETQEVHYLARTHQVNVYSGCDGLTAVSNDPWIGVISITRNSFASSTIAYVVLENTGERRTGTINVGNLTFTVVQIEAGPPCTVSVHPTSATAGPQGGSASMSVTLPAACPWGAATDVPWISIAIDTRSGVGNGSISYTVSRNFTRDSGGDEIPGPSRHGSIIVNGQAQLTVFQDAGNCPIKLICSFFPGVCQDDSQNLMGLARGFRDRVLASTPRGQRYTQLYYRFSTEAVSVILLNPMLILRSREILERYKPTLDSMARGEHTTISQNDLNDIESFLNTFAQKGSPELRESLKTLCEDLRDPQVHAEFNITITDGPRRDLPSRDEVQTVKQTGMMLAPIGLILFCCYAVRRRRHNERRS